MDQMHHVYLSDYVYVKFRAFYTACEKSGRISGAKKKSCNANASVSLLIQFQPKINSILFSSDYVTFYKYIVLYFRHVSYCNR